MNSIFYSYINPNVSYLKKDHTVSSTLFENRIDHEFDMLNKDEIHRILGHKWKELKLSITIEYFSDYETFTKITNGNFRLIQRLFSQIEYDLQ